MITDGVLICGRPSAIAVVNLRRYLIGEKLQFTFPSRICRSTRQ